jgi:hypothetical protein
MMFRYVRFKETVMSPGHAGSDVSTMRVRSSMNEGAVPREQLVDSIEARGIFLVITAKRVGPDGKTPRIYQRWVPLFNVRDADPLEVVMDDEEPEPQQPPKPKGK